MNTDTKDLIFGKNYTKNIVSIEVDSIGQCEIFIETKDGVIATTEAFKPFIIFSKPISPQVKTLKGNQPYKYYREYSTRDKYYEVLKKCNQKRVDFFTVRDAKEAFMCRHGYTYFKGMDFKDVSILSIDIEDTYGIREEPDINGKLLLIANTYRKNGKIERKQFAYDDYLNEREMLEAWAKWFRKMNPSILVGHNLYGHDLKIINYAARKYKLKLKLGRNDSEMFVANRDSRFRKDGSQAYAYKNITIYGREIVDTWFLAMKYDQASRREYENYKLKYVIKFEGLEKEGRVHYDAANIYKDYKDPKKWKMIKLYNNDDSDDALAYFDLVIPVFFQYNKSLPRSLQSVVNSATGSQVNSLMVRSYLQKGHSIAKMNEAEKYPGAISFGVPGLFKNVFKIDVQSLYPSIILTYELFDKKKDPRQNMLKMLKYFTEQRIKNKNLYKETKDIKYKILSDSQKIVCNSVYGFYGAPKLNYNCPRIAARVTEIGRQILQTALKWSVGSDAIPDNAVGGKVNGEEL